jgi:hypothetical protein
MVEDGGGNTSISSTNLDNLHQLLFKTSDYSSKPHLS